MSDPESRPDGSPGTPRQRRRVGLLVTGGVGVVVFGGFTALAAEVYEDMSSADDLAQLDQPALDWGISLRTGLNEQIATAFTHLGGTIGMTIIATVLTLLLAWRAKSWFPLLMMVIAAAGSLTMTTVGKGMIGRERPPTSEAVPPFESSFSFPSGHTLNSTVLMGMLAYLLFLQVHRRLVQVLGIVVAVVWSIAMGASRVFLGHHWLTDVLVAYCLGLAWLAVLISLHRLLFQRASRGSSRVQQE